VVPPRGTASASVSATSTAGSAAAGPHTAAAATADRPACGIRVGEGEAREWQVGEALVFDDSYNHESWNETDTPRTVLLFDVWHPEVTLPERSAITEMFAHAKRQGWLT